MGEHSGMQVGMEKVWKENAKTLAVIGLALLFGVVSSVTFMTSNVIGSRILGLNDSSRLLRTVPDTVNSNSASLSQTSSVVTSDVSSVVEKVMPSIVSITNMSVEEVQNFFGGVSEQKSESAGTGIIISQSDTELLIVTNNHVIQGSDTLTVTFNDGTSLGANIKGSDSEYDVAVIAVPLDSISDETMNSISVANAGRFYDIEGWRAGNRHRKCTWIWTVCHNRRDQCFEPFGLRNRR